MGAKGLGTAWGANTTTAPAGGFGLPIIQAYTAADPWRQYTDNGGAGRSKVAGILLGLGILAGVGVGGYCLYKYLKGRN